MGRAPRSSHTVGIDLAAQARGTAACVVAWADATARIIDFHVGLSDDGLSALLEDSTATKIGIDAPFGWLLEFVDAVRAYTTRGQWPVADESLLNRRETDRYVRLVCGQQPLSVSTDRIAYCAMRCARLLVRWSKTGAVDRSGTSRFVEVYPAAALRQWGFDPQRYKGPKDENVTRRRELVTKLSTAASKWLELTDANIRQCQASDHCLDALICALVARTVEVGRALPVEMSVRARARREGWIRLPQRCTLQDLGLRSHT